MNSQSYRLWKQLGRLRRIAHKIDGNKRGEQAVLGALYVLGKEQKEGVKASAVSNCLGLAQATVTPIIHRLEAEGKILQSRHEEDRRITLIRLSPLGEEYYQNYWQERKKQTEGLIEYLTPQDTEKLIELLERMTDYLSNTSNDEKKGDFFCCGKEEENFK